MMDFEKEETRRDYFTRLGKVGLAGLSTFLLINYYGREDLIEDLSQKDPNQLIVGVDFCAYNMVNKIDYKGRPLDIENWRIFENQRGIFLYSKVREMIYRSIYDWFEDTYANVMGFKPFFGEVSEKIALSGDPVDRRDTYERYNSSVFDRLGSEALRNNRKVIAYISDDPNDYKLLNYEKECVKCDIDASEYILEKVMNQMATIENDRNKEGFFIEIPYGKTSSKKLDSLTKEKKKEYTSKFKTILSFKEKDILVAKGNRWNLISTENLINQWQSDVVDCIIIEDISCTKDELARNIEKAKRLIGRKKMLVIRLACGFDRVIEKGMTPVADADDRLKVVLESDANGYLLNDGDGSWLFSGKANPVGWNEMERMAIHNFKKVFGIKT